MSGYAPPFEVSRFPRVVSVSPIHAPCLPAHDHLLPKTGPNMLLGCPGGWPTFISLGSYRPSHAIHVLGGPRGDPLASPLVVQTDRGSPASSFFGHLYPWITSLFSLFAMKWENYFFKNILLFFQNDNSQIWRRK